MWYFLIGLFCLLLGMMLGKILTDQNWRDNAYRPKRVYNKKRFYKVVNIEDPKSWELMKIHQR